MENESTLTVHADETVGADIVHDIADIATDGGAEIVEELLIEEISIDGMCGVY